RVCVESGRVVSRSGGGEGERGMKEGRGERKHWAKGEVSHTHTHTHTHIHTKTLSNTHIQGSALITETHTHTLTHTHTHTHIQSSNTHTNSVLLSTRHELLEDARRKGQPFSNWDGPTGVCWR